MKIGSYTRIPLLKSFHVIVYNGPFYSCAPWSLNRSKARGDLALL